MKSKTYADMSAARRYGESTKRKLNRKLYNEDMECAFICGFIDALGMLEARHKEDPYLTGDEAIGDAQIESVKFFNYYKNKFAYKSEGTVTVEKVML